MRTGRGTMTGCRSGPGQPVSPSPVASSGGRLKGYFPNTAIVAQAGGGDYTDPVAAMANLSSWCPAPSFSKSLPFESLCLDFTT